MGKKSKRGDITLSFIPYSDIEKLDSVYRVKKILDMTLKNQIVILQGRLEPEEETSLIQSTMALVGRIKNFKGIEIAVINPGKESQGFISKIKFGIARALVGQRDALTIVGPASLVKEIKRDPKKIDLMLKR
ncbi:MAG: DUF2073 domain-containing protein [Nanoarchaeota archaeon]|nr:DUF2073 domain-containing protein [Nanoarchaeota archaeon]